MWLLSLSNTSITPFVFSVMRVLVKIVAKSKDSATMYNLSCLSANVLVSFRPRTCQSNGGESTQEFDPYRICTMSLFAH